MVYKFSSLYTHFSKIYITQLIVFSYTFEENEKGADIHSWSDMKEYGMHGFRK